MVFSNSSNDVCYSSLRLNISPSNKTPSLQYNIIYLSKYRQNPFTACTTSGPNFGAVKLNPLCDNIPWLQVS